MCQPSLYTFLYYQIIFFFISFDLISCHVSVVNNKTWRHFCDVLSVLQSYIRVHLMSLHMLPEKIQIRNITSSGSIENMSCQMYIKQMLDGYVLNSFDCVYHVWACACVRKTEALYRLQVYGRNYYQPEHYVSKSVLQKMPMPCLKEEMLRLHASNANMSSEEAELQFLKVTFTSVLTDSACVRISP